jgi:hypothetical protein
MNKLFTLPSVMAHTLNGGLLIVGLALVLLNHRTLRNLPPAQLVMLVLVLSIAVGVHGLSHVGLESAYGYSPLNLLKLMRS